LDAINGVKIGSGELACILAFDAPELGSNAGSVRAADVTDLLSRSE
jgi:hypothetical protein